LADACTAVSGEAVQAEHEGRADRVQAGLVRSVAHIQANKLAGYLLKDSSIDVVAKTVRMVASGQRAIGSEVSDTLWQAPPDRLSDRERGVLRLAADGKSNKEIARVLGLSPGTVRNYLSEAAQKLGTSNRVEAGRIARRNGWL